MVKTIAVFGATGKTGRELVRQAIDRGYSIRALVRNPAKIETAGTSIHIVQGDAMDAGKAEETIRGTEAVLDVLGMAEGSPPDLKVVSTGHIVSAMQKHGVKRILKMASAPFGVPGEGDRPSFGQKLMTRIVQTMAKAPVRDDVISCEQLRESPVDWTIIRAPRLTHNPLGTSRYRIGSLGNSRSSVSRASVAAFFLDELENGQYIRKSPLVSN